MEEAPKVDIKPPTITARRIFGGLVWPEKGRPAYLCAVGESVRGKENTFEAPDGLEIYQEGEARTFDVLGELLLGLPKHVQIVYTDYDPRFRTYLTDFSRWKRDKGSRLRLYQSPLSNFEAGVLKIKQYTKDKRIIFPFGSTVRNQLTMLSVDSLKDATDLYAVRALTMAIGAFDKRKPIPDQESEPKLKAWW